MVAREDVRQPKDLKGKTIVLQQFGPHVDYLLRILSDAGLNPSDVTIRFARDITGKGADTPAAAMLADATVAAVMVISPDAATLTSGDGGGTGAEGSRKGAHVLLSTRSLRAADWDWQAQTSVADVAAASAPRFRQRLERRVHDLALTRTAPFQGLPAVALIEDNDTNLIERM